MRTLWIAFLTPVLALAMSAPATAAPKRQPAGVVISMSGKVQLYSGASAKADAQAAVPAKAPHRGQTLFAQDRIETGANGRLGLVLTDGTQLKLNYNTDITLNDRNSRGLSSARGIAAIKIFVGELWAKVTKKDSTLEFDTPSAVAAVKGTEPIFDVDPDGSTHIWLRSGKVRVSNEFSSGVTLLPNQQISVTKHQRINSTLVQAWNSSAPTWEQTFGQASGAAVTVRYVDQDGVTKTLVVNYAAGQGVTASAGAAK